MITYTTLLDEGIIRFVVDQGLYSVVMSSQGTVEVFQRNGQPDTNRAAIIYVMGMVLGETPPNPVALRTAILVLRRAGVNIAFAPALIEMAGNDLLVQEWVSTLPAKHRPAAEQAHRLLLTKLDGYGQTTVGQIAPLAKGA